MKTQKIKISQGDRFGILVVQREEILHGDHNKMYRCQCDCGGTGRFSYHALTSGKVRACGCRIGKHENPAKIILEPGVRHGRLMVIGSADNIGKKHNMGATLFQCDCGKQVIACSSQVLRGTTRSCGCLVDDSRTQFKSAHDVGLNKVFIAYKHGAKRRGLDFEISPREFEELTSQNCFYCGQVPLTPSLSKRPEGGGYYYNGLDRVDNSIGYILGNVVPCCELCNNMKHVLPIGVFLAQCKKIANKLVIGV